MSKNPMLILGTLAIGLTVPHIDHTFDPTGEGLYRNFTFVKPLLYDNFDREVYNNETSWMVEFYNSWCGDCHRFSPTFKYLAIDVQRWRKAFRIGGVDCTNPKNTKLCREHDITTYPTVKYFPRNSADPLDAVVFQERTLEGLKRSILERLLDECDDFFPRNETLEELMTGTDSDHILAVYEHPPSYVGSQLVLDFIEHPSVKVIIFSPNETETAILHQRNGTSVILDVSRPAILKYLNENFNGTPPHVNLSTYDISLITEQDVKNALNFQKQLMEKLQPKKLSSTVFRVDIESALSKTLFIEISSKNSISEKMLQDLKNYLQIIKKYFPFQGNGHKFMECIIEGVDNETYSGIQFQNLSTSCLEKNQPVFLSSKDRFLGCKGSAHFFRGYPCSLWTMFHTLTVQADLLKSGEPREVLDGMTGYIRHFFGCSFCARHFLKMSTTIAGNVTSFEDNVLWLWKAHNNVNKRLYNDATQDPTHIKYQFPTKESCQNCTLEDGSYDEQQVLNFMRKMYTDISPIVTI